jgi:beta-lactamase class A
LKRVAFLAGIGAASGLVLRVPALAAAAVQRTVVRVAYDLPGTIGVYARTLAPGPPIAAYRAYESFPTASIIKVLIMTTAYVLQERGRNVLDQRIRFDRSELIGGSDFLANAADGTVFTVRELIVPMIQVSDNTAANILMGHLGIATINAVGARAGLDRTHLARKFLDWSAVVLHHENVSTPGDMAHLLYLIERGAHEGVATIASPAHCRTMVDIMLGQTDRDAIPAGLPRGVAVANKTGEIEGTRNDIAIVQPFGETPFIIAIMTKNVTDYGAAYAAMHTIAAAAYRAAR